MSGITERLKVAIADRYVVERELGAGGMATVYLAHDLKHDRKVALKVLRPELAAVLGADRFVQEIKTTAALQHPHILPLYDSGRTGTDRDGQGRTDEFLFYVMPYIQGETLREKLNRETQLGIDEAVGIATSVADALDYAHRNGVIHRDIKPENILLHDGRAMVADFGIALAVSAAAGGRMTETGLSLGTPHYMSPEQATAEKDLSARSDVYSLGSVLYELLAGQPPHLGGSAQQIIMKIVTEEAAPVTKMRKAVPPHVAAAVAKSLEKLPADRFATAAEFAAALKNPAFTTAVGTATATTVPPFRHSAATAVLAAVAIVATALAAWGWLGRATTEGPPPVTVRTSVSDIEFPSYDERPEISRDGSLIAVRRPSAGPQLFIRRTDELEFRALPGTEGAVEMTFSPDGRWLAFRQGDRINRIEVSGGPVLPVATGFDPHWGTEDVIVFKGDGGALFTVSPTGGDPVRWSATDSLNPRVPFLLPTGKAVVFSTMDGGDHTLMVLDLTSGRVTSLGLEGSCPRYVPAGYLLFGHAEQALMAVPFDVGRNEVTGEAFTVLPDVAVRRIGESMFTVSDNGTMLYSTQVAGGEGRLVEVAVDGSSSDTLPPAVGQFQEPRYSPDGRHIAYAGDEGIWTYDRETGAKTLVVADGGNAVWSPDGRHIYFSGTGGVYRASLDTPADPEHVVTPGSGQYLWPNAAAPNGGEVLLGEWAGAGRGINLLVMRPDQADPGLRDYLVADWHEMAGAISPDGRWVAYSSNESGTWEVYVRRLGDAGGQVRVSSGGGFGPRWAPDGTAIYYVSGGRGGAGSTDREIRRSAVRSGASFQAGPPGIAFRGPFLTSQSVFPAANFDLHPDGSRLLVVQPVGEAVSTQPTVYLVANWFEELRRRAPN